jgi:hypothetical protein
LGRRLGLFSPTSLPELIGQSSMPLVGIVKLAAGRVA